MTNEIQPQELHRIILHNDDETHMNFVTFVLQSIFDKSQKEAMRITHEVHNKGKGIVGSYSLPMAQAKVGAVKLMAGAKQFPLRCTIENYDEHPVPAATSSIDRSISLPSGWMTHGSYPNDYAVKIDESVFHSGKQSARVQNSVDAPRAFFTLMQSFSPELYQGKRLSMHMWVKTEDVEGHSQPWMRVDGRRRGQMLGFDNCCGERRIVGTNDWQKYDLVLDVPSESTNIAFGVILTGRGKVWIDDIEFEVVSDEIMTTDCRCMTAGGRSKHPRNLAFEDQV